MTDQPVSLRAAVIFLVDAEGQLLLQLRDAHAPVAPNLWGLPGGAIEPDEEPDTAVRRELLEETGLSVNGSVTLFWHGMRPSARQNGTLTEWFVFCARTSARQEDVVLGEGAAMEFIASDKARTLNLYHDVVFFLDHFLDSGEYQRLTKHPALP